MLCVYVFMAGANTFFFLLLLFPSTSIHISTMNVRAALFVCVRVSACVRINGAIACERGKGRAKNRDGSVKEEDFGENVVFMNEYG